jgi:hypothetical protein
MAGSPNSTVFLVEIQSKSGYLALWVATRGRQLWSDSHCVLIVTYRPNVELHSRHSG